MLNLLTKRGGSFFSSLTCFFSVLTAVFVMSASDANAGLGKGERIMSFWVYPTLGTSFIFDDPLLESKLNYGLLKGAKLGLGLSDHNSTVYLAGGWASSKIKLKADRRRFPGQRDFPSAIATSYGEVELSAYYREKNWEFGPSLMLPFGTDTSFSPAEVAEEKAHFFAGAGLKYGSFDFRKKSLLSLELQAYLDLNIKDRNVGFLKFMLGVGFPVKLAPEYIYRTKIREKIKTVVEYRTRTEKQFIVDAGVINFTTNSATIDQTSSRYLNALATHLNKHLRAWDYLDISAHTDKRGSWQFNQNLAMRRGDAVRLFFHRAGIPIQRSRLKVRSFDEPIETANTRLAFARNRRVEITVIGKVAMKELKKQILLIQQKFKLPSTCKKGNCR